MTSITKEVLRLEKIYGGISRIPEAELKSVRNQLYKDKPVQDHRKVDQALQRRTNKIIELNELGYGNESIASQVGVSISTVEYWLYKRCLVSNTPFRFRLNDNENFYFFHTFSSVKRYAHVKQYVTQESFAKKCPQYKLKRVHDLYLSDIYQDDYYYDGVEMRKKCTK